MKHPRSTKHPQTPPSARRAPQAIDEAEWNFGDILNEINKDDHEIVLATKYEYCRSAPNLRAEYNAFLSKTITQIGILTDHIPFEFTPNCTVRELLEDAGSEMRRHFWRDPQTANFFRAIWSRMPSAARLNDAERFCTLFIDLETPWMTLRRKIPNEMLFISDSPDPSLAEIDLPSPMPPPRRNTDVIQIATFLIEWELPDPELKKRFERWCKTARQGREPFSCTGNPQTAAPLKQLGVYRLDQAGYSFKDAKNLLKITTYSDEPAWLHALAEVRKRFKLPKFLTGLIPKERKHYKYLDRTGRIREVPVPTGGGMRDNLSLFEGEEDE